MKAKRNGESVLQSFWMMGILAMRPVAESSPLIFANLNDGFTISGWGVGNLGGVGGRGDMGRSGDGVFEGEHTRSGGDGGKDLFFLLGLTLEV